MQILNIARNFAKWLFSINDWETKIGIAPKQKNCSDCGVFMLNGVKYFAFGKNPDFEQGDIFYFRILIAVELIKGALKN